MIDASKHYIYIEVCWQRRTIMIVLIYRMGLNESDNIQTVDLVLTNR